jgi:hypothetical protein
LAVQHKMYTQQANFPIAVLPSGIYLVRLLYDNHFQSEKIIIW